MLGAGGGDGRLGGLATQHTGRGGWRWTKQVKSGQVESAASVFAHSIAVDYLIIYRF